MQVTTSYPYNARNGPFINWEWRPLRFPRMERPKSLLFEAKIVLSFDGVFQNAFLAGEKISFSILENGQKFEEM